MSTKPPTTPPPPPTPTPGPETPKPPAPPPPPPSQWDTFSIASVSSLAEFYQRLRTALSLPSLLGCENFCRLEGHPPTTSNLSLNSRQLLTGTWRVTIFWADMITWRCFVLILLERLNPAISNWLACTDYLRSTWTLSLHKSRVEEL